MFIIPKVKGQVLNQNGYVLASSPGHHDCGGPGPVKSRGDRTGVELT